MRDANSGSLVAFTASAFNLAITSGGVATGTPTVGLSGAQAGQFSIFANGCTAALAPTGTAGNSCTITVNFQPTSTGVKAGSLDISTTPGGNKSISLNGTGTITAAIGLTPTPKDFGKPSVYDGDIIGTAEASYLHWTEELKLTSVGVLAVTAGECSRLSLQAVTDGVQRAGALR